MRTVMVWCGCLGLGAVLGWAEPAPRIACDNSIYDFGAQAGTGTVQHVFLIRNDGDKLLQIESIRACCGATATIAEKQILPGTNTTLQVVFPLAGREGVQHKSFYVVSNDPVQPYLQLRFTGQIVSSVAHHPTNTQVKVTEVTE